MAIAQPSRHTCPSDSDAELSMQGKKSPNRMADLQSCCIGFEAILDVLGLWKGQPQDIIREMRRLALTRQADTFKTLERNLRV